MKKRREEEEDVEDADEATRDEMIDQLEILIEWERRRQIHYSYTWCTRHYYFTLFITHIQYISPINSQHTRETKI